MDRNKYGLSRNQGQKIIQNLIREVNFVCPARDANGQCDSIILTWHHFDPVFSECHEHNPEGIIALCPNHHCKADKGEYSKSEMREWKKNPNIKDISEIKTKVSFLDRKDLHINIANSFLKENRANIKCGESFIKIKKGENGIILFNLKITDINGKPIFYLRNNVFNPATKEEVIQVWPKKLKIRIKGEKTDLKIIGIRVYENNYEKKLKEQSLGFVRRFIKQFEEFEKSEGRKKLKGENYKRMLKRLPPDYSKDIKRVMAENYRRKEREFKQKVLLDPNEQFEILKNYICPDSLLIFLKGKIYFKDGHADLDNAFKASDGSAIIKDILCVPDIEIGKNFVGSR